MLLRKRSNNSCWSCSMKTDETASFSFPFAAPVWFAMGPRLLRNVQIQQSLDSNSNNSHNTVEAVVGVSGDHQIGLKTATGRSERISSTGSKSETAYKELPRRTFRQRAAAARAPKSILHSR